MTMMSAAALLLPLALTATLVAQDGPSFDVVSVKPNASGASRASLNRPRGQISAVNIPLHWLIRDAYGIQDYHLVGGPSWITQDRFDIIARPPAGATPEDYRAMARNLLRERFGLISRIETRELPIYRLVMARGDRRLGSGLRPTGVTDCQAVRGTAQSCGTNFNNGDLKAVAVTLAEFSTVLAQFVDRPVFDHTGLGGRYDVQVTWTGDPRRPLTAGADGASIFTALQEQLGLELDAEKGPVEVLVIERVEQPTAD